ncbi:MAG: NAD(P)(+) transhydrogenase (Re/Si-specific) subunit beta [Methylacidiphilales bacterium]|nr:NAD(P)(+) transhydrogenase (Re/Si-specific) subunit beta [Candidatus Methylacidiphilales bacterium]
MILNMPFLEFFVSCAYFISSMLFLFGLKQMASPKTASQGFSLAGIGMLLATGATILVSPHNTMLMILALTSASLIAWYSGKKVAMTAMPQMVALYNGMGGGAAAAIALLELMKHTQTSTHSAIAFAGGLIGAISFTGSIVAFAKLQGLLTRTIRLPLHHTISLLVLLLSVATAIFTMQQYSISLIFLFFISALLLGILITIPVGGADMPVIISLFNGFTGLAVGLEGLVLGNPAMIIAGTVVGASGTLLTQLMAKAMNRSILQVLFSSFGNSESTSDTLLTLRTAESEDIAVQLAYAQKVIIIPGYGLAVAQAQQKVAELTTLLRKKDITILFAIHPVAGRMPGHMNVLLAEAGIDYDLIKDMDEINPEFASCDVAIVVGANDVINPSARNDKNSPLYGMPILDVDAAKQIVVIKRGSGKGFSGVENPLFGLPNCSMLYGDAQAVLATLLANVKQVD